MEAIKISEAIKLSGEELADKLWLDVHDKVLVDRNDSEYRSWKQSLPMLIKSVNDAGLGNIMLVAEYKGRFHEFLKCLFSDEEKDCSEAVSVLFENNYRITDLDMGVFKDITSKLESITLIEDQINCMECINMAIDRLLAETLNGKQMFVVKGGAGTGKTIVGFKLISDYCQAVLDGIGGGLQTVFLNNLRETLSYWLWMRRIE